MANIRIGFIFASLEIHGRSWVRPHRSGRRAPDLIEGRRGAVGQFVRQVFHRLLNGNVDKPVLRLKVIGVQSIFLGF